MKDLFSIKDKVALITGGSRGLGYMMAKGYLENGARVYITSRKEDACHEAAAGLAKFGTCIAVPVDITNANGLSALAQTISQKEEGLHILINNAGAGWEAPMESFPEFGWDKVLDVNVKALFYTTREFLPLLEAAGTPLDPARVINIGSIAAFISNSMGLYSYGPSKAAVHHLTQSLARELAQQNITVNAIAPGRFPSRMTHTIIENKEVYEAELKQIPFHRYGKEEDIAGLAIFLASKASAYMTGSIISLDGGLAISGL